MHLRRFTLPAAAATAALGLVALSAGSASAHVTVTPDTTAAGGYAVLTFSVPHGCEGSPTTKIAIAMPDDVPQVTPTVNPGWTVEKVQEKLDPPVKDAHGNEVTERVSQVVYTARTPLPDGYRDTLALSLQLPEKEGETLTFPIVQTCAKGSTVDIEQCVGRLTKAWDQRLNAAYQKIIKGNRNAYKMRIAQRLWVQFRNANCRYYGAGEGTIRRLEFAECMRSATAHRALELEDLLKGPGG